MTTAKMYNFMGLRKIAAGLSIALLLISVASLAINGLKFGLDFTGGSLVEVGYEQTPDLNQIRGRLESQGFS